jgi:hypothetical protein
VAELLFQIVEMQGDLAVDVAAHGPAERAEPGHDELEQQGCHEGALRVMQPVAIAPGGVVALRRRQSLLVASDKIVDDGPGFSEAQRAILDDRRFSQGMDAPEARWGEHGLRVPLVTNDFVVEANLLKQPQDAQRAGIVEMMDLDQGREFSRRRDRSELLLIA